ncbi:hypothetical protein MKW94_000419 [Papaver nudicaule]|uniref:Uncharacterized protein n=1 Tax=Papaver nudicaule TaxID=74823 RepID=A0AA41VR42_PAPNU|nr:hypothetical protein [Papaver nudicaule]
MLRRNKCCTLKMLTPIHPTQGSQCIVNLDDDSIDSEFWKKLSVKANDIEEAVNATKEQVLHLENVDADDCHPEDQPWSQPLMYSEREDDEDWSEFLQNFSMKSSGPEEDSEKENEDDNYDQLLETDDEAEVVKDVHAPLIDAWIEENKRNELDNEQEDEYGPEMVDKPLPNDEVRFVDNGPVRNLGNGPLLTDSDFEDFFAADMVDPELFPEPKHEEQVVAEDTMVEGMEFPDKKLSKDISESIACQLGQYTSYKRAIILGSRLFAKVLENPFCVLGLYLLGESLVSQLGA